jgi:hypothetical protein
MINLLMQINRLGEDINGLDLFCVNQMGITHQCQLKT